jgi:hypothetical protein
MTATAPVPALGRPVVIDPARVSANLATKATRLADAQAASREAWGDDWALYLIGGDTGVYWNRLHLGQRVWTVACEHERILVEQGVPVHHDPPACSHGLLAAACEAAKRGRAIPDPRTPDPAEPPYEIDEGFYE